MPEGLRTFLTAWPTVQIVGHPQIREKIGAVPLSVKVPDDPSGLFSESRVMPMERSHPYYLPEFWQAFYTPLAGRRFVVLPNDQNPNVRIVNRPDGEEEPGGYEILASDVALTPISSPLSEKVQATSQKIKEWLTRNSLSDQLFISQTPAPSRRQFTERIIDERDLVGKSERGLTDAAVRRAVTALVAAVRAEEAHHEPARFSVWTYEPRASISMAMGGFRQICLDRACPRCQ
jgi:hypothetical protein